VLLTSLREGPKRQPALSNRAAAHSLSYHPERAVTSLATRPRSCCGAIRPDTNRPAEIRWLRHDGSHPPHRYEQDFGLAVAGAVPGRRLRDKTRPARIPPLGIEVEARVVAATQTDAPGGKGICFPANDLTASGSLKSTNVRFGVANCRRCNKIHQAACSIVAESPPSRVSGGCHAVHRHRTEARGAW
jgi:hypothetical protein